MRQNPILVIECPILHLQRSEPENEHLQALKPKPQTPKPPNPKPQNPKILNPTP